MKMYLLLTIVAICFAQNTFNLNIAPTFYQNTMSLQITVTLDTIGEINPDNGYINFYAHFFIDYLPDGEFLPFATNRIQLNNSVIVEPEKSDYNPTNEWKVFMETHSNSLYFFINTGAGNAIRFDPDEPSLQRLVLNLDGLPLLKRARMVPVRAYMLCLDDVEESDDLVEVKTYTATSTAYFQYQNSLITYSDDKNTISLTLEPSKFYQNITLIEVVHDQSSIGTNIVATSNTFFYNISTSSKKQDPIVNINASNVNSTYFQLISTSTGRPLLYRDRIIINMTYPNICNTFINSSATKISTKLYQDTTLIDTINTPKTIAADKQFNYSLFQSQNVINEPRIYHVGRIIIVRNDSPAVNTTNKTNCTNGTNCTDGYVALLKNSALYFALLLVVIIL